MAAIAGDTLRERRLDEPNVIFAREYGVAHV